MANNRRSDGLWAFLLAAALSFGGVGCVTTGFALEQVDLGVLLVVCIGCSLAFVIAGYFRHGIPVVATVSVVVMILKRQELTDSIEVLLYQISSALNRGYGWDIIRWSAVHPIGSAELALSAVACTVSLIVVFTVLRQKRATVAAIAAFLPMMVCLLLTDTVPDNDYLMLMLGGLTLLALTNPLRCKDAAQANRLTAVLLVPVILATVCLFWVVPREGYTPNQSMSSRLEQWLEENPLWQMLTGKGPLWSMGDSGADEIPLDMLGGKSESNRTAFYVTSTASGYLYLRGRGYDTYDGKSWTASEYSSGYDNGWAKVISGSDRVTVRMEHARKFYYFPSECGPKGTSQVFEYGMMPNTYEKTTYTFYWGKPVRAATLREEVRKQCLQLPEETEKWAKQVLRDSVFNVVTSFTGSQSFYAQRIAELVRDSAQYSLYPSLMSAGEQDFAKWFYSEAEAGYCVHFATTATVLLRAAGIPARYVTGYALEVQPGDEIAVLESRAHAWVEYYNESTGWTVLDATPGYNEPELPTVSTTEPTTEPTTETTETTLPSSRPTNPTHNATEQTTPSATLPDTPLRPTPGQKEENELGGRITAVVLWILAICAAVWGQYRLRIRIRKWYTRRGSVNQQALARWRAVRVRSRIFRQKLPSQLRALAEKAKYSQHTLTAEELRRFDLHMAALAAKLQKKPWLLRWLLRLLLAIE